MGVFDVFQIPYSALQRKHEELILDAAAAGAGVLIRGGAGKGAPSGEARAVERNRNLADTWEQATLDECPRKHSAPRAVLARKETKDQRVRLRIRVRKVIRRSLAEMVRE
jgi:hypothetical protein